MSIPLWVQCYLVAGVCFVLYLPIASQQRSSFHAWLQTLFNITMFFGTALFLIHVMDIALLGSKLGL